MAVPPFRSLRWGALYAAAAVLALGAPLRAAEARFVPESGRDPAWNACLAQASAIEAEENLPERMLAAVTTVEAGRPSPDGRSMQPWPWTIFAEGKGQHFATKEAAIAAVRALRARGVLSIDVGCMQINLRYHPRAFTSLEEAFDPISNVRYGAQFLQSLKRTHLTWDLALEHYHSYDPARRQSYRALIFAAWMKVQAADQKFWVASDVPPRLPGESGADAQIGTAAWEAPLLAPRESRPAAAADRFIARGWRDRASIEPAARLTGGGLGMGRAAAVSIAVDLTPRPGDRGTAQRRLAALPARPDVALASANGPTETAAK